MRLIVLLSFVFQEFKVLISWDLKAAFHAAAAAVFLVASELLSCCRYSRYSKLIKWAEGHLTGYHSSGVIQKQNAALCPQTVDSVVPS